MQRALSQTSDISTSPPLSKACYKKKNAGSFRTSDKIDRVVTNRWLGLPIFAVIMFLVYYISMVDRRFCRNRLGKRRTFR